MSTREEAPGRSATPADALHAVAFSIQISRNLVMHVTVLAMVSLVGLNIVSWPIVLGWTAVAIAVASLEYHAIRLMSRGGRAQAAAGGWAAALRILTTGVYAVAALALILRGGSGERLFAFALVTASMVHVLMRYYRAPLVLMASITPYILVLTFAGFRSAIRELHEGHLLAALAPVFAIAIFAIQLWSARTQLAAAWAELMTAREDAEARERAADAANRAKSAFLANMSHELRTPLNGVLGMVQALTADELTRAQLERVKIIRRSSENLLSVLNDLLDLSKIETSNLDLEMVEFDLEHLVRGVAAAYKPLASKKDLTFEFDVAEAARGRYRGDSARIRRVLYSLADNAVKFTQAGGITLRVELDGDEVLFRIADTGIGIAEADLGRLFEGFFQADSTLSRRYAGAGIGLAVCSELTTLMGGAIQVESRPAEGSTFTLRLRLERAGPEVEAEPPEAVAPVAAEPERSVELRVLAAEDNAVNQLVLKTLLAPAGITPTMVENGKEAVAAWESQTWDIVLMDIQMPEMDGVEATRIIRRREAETGRARTPIIAVTANAMTHQVADYEAAGMDGVVAKPVDMAVLFNVMEGALAEGGQEAGDAQQAAQGQ